MAYEFEEIMTINVGDTFKEYVCKSGMRWFLTDNDEIMTGDGFRKFGRLREGDKIIVDKGDRRNGHSD